jgi:hypothetical protein
LPTGLRSNCRFIVRINPINLHSQPAGNDGGEQNSHSEYLSRIRGKLKP